MLQHKQKLYSCFIDLEKAYDKIDRGLLWTVFVEYLGLPVEVVNALKLLYSKLKASIVGDGCNDLELIAITIGLK